MGTLTDSWEPQRLASQLAVHLRARGCLTDPRWERALREARRDLFVPDAAWFKSNHAIAPDGRFAVGDDPAAWLAAVYSDTSAIIQTDDGAGDPTSGKGKSSSSVSSPGVVFPFLELLDPREGDRVLEIGTGSGWTAAMLSWAAGSGTVTSIEVDPAIGPAPRSPSTRPDSARTWSSETVPRDGPSMPRTTAYTSQRVCPASPWPGSSRPGQEE